MKPAPFFYTTPTTVEEAIALLVEHGDEAKLLAGGQSLVPMMNFRLVRPEHLIDLNRLEGLDYITERDGILAVGAMTRQRRLERSDLIRQHYPLIAAATAVLGHPASRNRGTVGGSIAHADLAAELPALLRTYGGSVIVQGSSGRRQIPAEAFFVTYLTTALEPSDMIVEVQFSQWPAGTGWCFLEESRRHGDFAVAGVTALLTLDANGLCSQVAVTLFGVGGVPIRIEAASDLLVGYVPDEDRIAAVAQTVPGQVEPESDIHASADFRRHLSTVLTRRALRQAAERATS
jgi:aerobic carbon-monoxide dehydrogenase medium subunit